MKVGSWQDNNGFMAGYRQALIMRMPKNIFYPHSMISFSTSKRYSKLNYTFVLLTQIELTSLTFNPIQNEIFY